MNYDALRAQARNGDLLLLEGSLLGSILIRAFTAQQMSHVALLLWLDDGLWVAEMRAPQGYTLTPASQRVPEMAQHGQVYWGVAPDAVREREYLVRTAAMQYRGYRYSWWTLVTVWLAQVLRRRMPRSLVCSTFIEKVWHAAGITFPRTPDPGDFLEWCQYSVPLQPTDKE